VAETSSIERADATVWVHSHHRKRELLGPRSRGLVLPSGMMRIQLRELADIHRCDEPKQQKQCHCDSVRMTARAVNADATQREYCCNDEVKERDARHRGYSPASRSLHSARRPATEVGAKLQEIDVQDGPRHPSRRGSLAGRLLDGVEHNGMPEVRHG
jgi:hypothetical protein